MTKVEDIRIHQLRRAITNIQNRAERNPENEFLKGIYVDCGILDRLAANQNEIVVGRRGTGKTHLLKAYAEKEFIESNSNDRLCYIDCNTIESGISTGATSENHGNMIFRRILGILKEYLLYESSKLELPNDDREREIIEKLSQFDTACSEYLNGHVEPAKIIRSLEETLDKLKSDRLVVVLDEWVTIPELSQPYLAERLKRVFFSSRRICFKIAAVDYRSLMRIQVEGKQIGFEKGADIVCSVDLDDYFVYDRNKEHVEDLFAQILFNHIFSSFPDAAILLANLPAMKVEVIRRDFFTTKEAFIELVRAGEGVVRDFLQIFKDAYFLYFFPNRDQKKIGINDIRKAAGSWYQKDKLDAIRGNDLEKCLAEIISDVIGRRKARTFMAEQGLSRHPVLQKLFESRLIHLIRRGWSHKDEPGKRYDLFTIDFGAYVELINTTGSPQLDLFENIEYSKDTVPYDDKRSIRRIVLPPEMLDKYNTAS